VGHAEVFAVQLEAERIAGNCVEGQVGLLRKIRKTGVIGGVRLRFQKWSEEMYSPGIFSQKPQRGGVFWYNITIRLMAYQINGR